MQKPLQPAQIISLALHSSEIIAALPQNGQSVDVSICQSEVLATAEPGVGKNTTHLKLALNTTL